MGGNAENLLGMEWVTPEGEIVRTGSLGSGDGWFCSEGPGPSVRGICRGTLGSRGGLGVYTKCAVKLAPHFGPTEWNVDGHAAGVPSAGRTRTCASTRSPCPAGTPGRSIYYKIYDNEIGYIFHRQFNLAGADLAPAFWLMYNDHTKTLSDVPELVADPEIAELTEEMRISSSSSSRAARRTTSSCRTGSSTPSSRRPAAGRSSASASRTWPSSPTCTCSGSATSTSTSSGPAATSAAGCSSARRTG